MAKAQPVSNVQTGDSVTCDLLDAVDMVQHLTSGRGVQGGVLRGLEAFHLAGGVQGPPQARPGCAAW